MKIKYFLIATFLACLICRAVFAENVTLQSALDAAYQNNEEIKSQEYLLESSQNLKTKALTEGILPDVSVDVNRGDKKNKIAGNASISGSVNTRNVNISQNLFNGGKNLFDYKRAKSIVEKSKFDLVSLKQDIALQIIQSYVDILKTTDLLEISAEDVKSHLDILEYTKKKSQSRDASKADLARAEADYIASLSKQNNLKNNLILAKANFVRLTGMEVKQIENLVKFSEENLNKKRETLNLVDIANEALENNPNLKSVAQNYEATKFETSIAKSNFSPTATFNLQSSEDRQSIFFNNKNQRNDSVFINFHIPILSKGVEYSDLSYAKNKEAAEKYNLQSVRKKIIETSVLYTRDMNNFYQNYNSALQNEKANEVYFESTKIEKEYGTKSVLDLLIAKQQFYESQVNRISYYYDYIMAVFKLEALIGRLSTSII